MEEQKLYTREEFEAALRQAYYKGRNDEYEMSQFIPDGISKCPYVSPDTCFKNWLNKNYPEVI